MSTKTNSSPLFRNLLISILLAWLIAGSMDALAAIINYTAQGNKEPAKIWRYIAKAAFGMKTTIRTDNLVAWGLLFHYLIALGWTILFFLIYPRIKWLQQNIVLGGLLYGIFVWVMMNRVVVPLSQLPPAPFKLKSAIINMVILMICIGLPVALVARKHYLYKK